MQRIISRIWLFLLFCMATPAMAQSLCTPDGHFSAAFAATIDYGFVAKDVDGKDVSDVTGIAPDETVDPDAAADIDYDSVLCPLHDDQKFVSGVVCLVQSIVAFSMFEVYCGVLDFWRPIFFAALAVWFALFFLAMILKLKDPSKWGESVVAITKVIIIAMLATNADAFFGVVYQGFLRFINDFMVVPFGLAGVSSPGASFEIVDSLFNVMVGEAHTHSMTVLAGALALSTTGFGIIFSLLLGTGLVSMFWAFIRLISGYATSMMAMTFLLMFFPIFMTFLLFKQTMSWGINYIASLLAYASQLVFTMIFVFTIIRAMATPITELTETIFADQKDTIIVRNEAHLDKLSDDFITATATAMGSTATDVGDQREFIRERIGKFTPVELANLKQDDHPVIVDGCRYNPDFNKEEDDEERPITYRWTATNAIGYFDEYNHTFVRSRYKVVTHPETGYPIGAIPKESCDDYTSGVETVEFDPVDKLYKKSDGTALDEQEYNRIEYVVHAFKVGEEKVVTPTTGGSTVEVKITYPPALDLDGNYEYFYTVTHDGGPGGNGYRGMNACPLSVAYNSQPAGESVKPLFACGLYMLGTKGDDTKASNLHINVPGPLIAAYPSKKTGFEDDGSGNPKFTGLGKVMKIILGFIGVWIFTDMLLSACLSLIPKLTKNIIEFFQYRGVAVTMSKSGQQSALVSESAVGTALKDINQLKQSYGVAQNMFSSLLTYSKGLEHTPGVGKGFGSMRDKIVSTKDSISTYLATNGLFDSERRERVYNALEKHRATVQRLRDNKAITAKDLEEAIRELRSALNDAGGSHVEIEEMLEYLQYLKEDGKQIQG